ncbi:MAG: hypothetical protein ACREFI_11680, partial [Stellaceae bacterium]
ANLMEEVYDLLSGLYTPAANGTAFLAFEKLGVPISSGMFKLQPTDTALSPALAVERVSEIANAVLTVDGDSVQRSNRTIDNTVELLLLQAAPVASDQLQSLGAAKNAANAAFDTTLGSLEGAFRYHPVYASPSDWYDPQAAGNWTLHTLGQQQGPAPAPPAPPAPPRRIRVDQPKWTVLPAQTQPALSQPVRPTRPYFIQTAAPRPVVAPAVRAAAVSTPVRPQAIAAQPAIAALAQFAMSSPAVRAGLGLQPATPPAAAPPPSALGTVVQALGPLAAAFATEQLGATGTPQPVAADNVSLSFEHCVVTLTRHWFPQILFMIKNWYVPGYTSGSFSAGTGVGDAGLLPILAGGFVAIRNLRISAKWSAQDLAVVQGSTAFGPFSLVGRSYDAGSGTLSCPGIQIIAWFCEALPVLPPASDPATTGDATPAATTDGAAAPAPDAAGTQGAGAPQGTAP